MPDTFLFNCVTYFRRPLARCFLSARGASGSTETPGHGGTTPSSQGATLGSSAFARSMQNVAGGRESLHADCMPLSKGFALECFFGFWPPRALCHDNARSRCWIRQHFCFRRGHQRSAARLHRQPRTAVPGVVHIYIYIPRFFVVSTLLAATLNQRGIFVSIVSFSPHRVGRTNAGLIEEALTVIARGERVKF